MNWHLAWRKASLEMRRLGREGREFSRYLRRRMPQVNKENFTPTKNNSGKKKLIGLIH